MIGLDTNVTPAVTLLSSLASRGGSVRQRGRSLSTSIRNMNGYRVGQCAYFLVPDSDTPHSCPVASTVRPSSPGTMSNCCRTLPSRSSR